jgi:hypothetical protein
MAMILLVKHNLTLLFVVKQVLGMNLMMCHLMKQYQMIGHDRKVAPYFLPAGDSVSAHRLTLQLFAFRCMEHVVYYTAQGKVQLQIIFLGVG